MIKKRRSQRFDGFSLIEVLLVLALVGVLAGLVAGNAGAFIKGAQFEPPSRVLKKAILDAIYEASESKNPTYVSYDKKTASFVVKNSTGSELSVLPIYKDDWNEEFESPEVVFTAIGPGSGPSGELSSYNDDELILSRIPFHYGSTVPFLATIHFHGKDTNLQFDPFSGFVLNKAE